MSQEKEPTIPKNLKLTHNGYFRETFQMKRLAKSFLERTLPKETLACLNLKKLTIETGESTDELFKSTIADVVYRVPIKGTKEHVSFYVLIEHKSRQDFQTIFQLWAYVYQVCRQDFQAAKKRTSYRLPPVIAVIVYHGRSRFRGVTELSDLFASLPGLEPYLPKLQAILVDLSCIDDDDPMMNDPEAPELKVVLMTLKTIFRKDVSMKIAEVLAALKPYSDDPDMRRLIRATWVYLANNARHLKRNFDTLQNTFEEVVGEKVMSTLAEMWKAEGKAEGEAIGVAKGKAEGVAEGEARGKVLAILEVRFNRIPKEIEDSVRSMTDLIALESLVEQAKACQSLEEFSEALK
jgi:predicted transposase/invertase (TIGR01784 family)